MSTPNYAVASEPEKGWLQSKTFWGITVAGVSILAPKYVPLLNVLPPLVNEAVFVGSLLFGLFGRKKASAPVSGLLKTLLILFLLSGSASAQTHNYDKDDPAGNYIGVGLSVASSAALDPRTYPVGFYIKYGIGLPYGLQPFAEGEYHEEALHPTLFFDNAVKVARSEARGTAGVCKWFGKKEDTFMPRACGSVEVVRQNFAEQKLINTIFSPADSLTSLNPQFTFGVTIKRNFDISYKQTLKDDFSGIPSSEARGIDAHTARFGYVRPLSSKFNFEGAFKVDYVGTTTLIGPGQGTDINGGVLSGRRVVDGGRVAIFSVQVGLLVR